MDDCPMKMKILLIVLFLAGQAITAQKLDSTIFDALYARNIGPAGMSGRVTAIDVTGKNHNIIYAGTASGGLWRSINSGHTWQPIFDKEAVHSIGAVKVQPDNPDIIWVGTGEGNPRNSHSAGNGVYKSIDGGSSWKHLGLENSRNIHRIIIHRDNPDIIFLSVMGSAWADTEERGVYKSTDGGTSWEKVLFVNPRTGCADLVADPSNPNKMFAAMWEYRREPWFFKSGGKGSGLYITYDAGETWKKIEEKGLPKGELGRIGIAISKSRPEYVYAILEAEKNGLYRSTDGGKNWTLQTTQGFGDRPFYYSEIYCDPRNENRLYSIFTFIGKSEDGGKNFDIIAEYSAIHPDHHAFWINEDDPNHLIDGTDGGINISYDMGKTWSFIDNLPLGQFYHINIDNDFPYNVYGGLQDNGTWMGPNTVLASGGIRNSYWEEVFWGDGFDVMPDLADNRFIYAMWQGGNLGYYDKITGRRYYIKPFHPEGKELRFNWNAAIAQDPFDSSMIYYGSQFLHKSSDRGATWDIISPDLTTNDTTKLKQLKSGGLTADVTTAENHCTIITISPSPKKQGVIWLGTDDGNLQVTQDSGRIWNNTAPNFPDVPPGSWIPQVNASLYNEGEAFAIVNNYRRNDWQPYLMHTNNYGKSWVNLASGKDITGYCLSFVQDPKNPSIMFLGTELGLYASLDAGKSWSKWKGSYPTASTMDLKIQPNEDDLVIGTFGRAIWIVDNFSSLREIADSKYKCLDKPLNIYDIPTSYIMGYKSPPGNAFPGHTIYKGESSNYNCMITASINRKLIEEEIKKDTSRKISPDTLLVSIYDEKGNNIRNFKQFVKNGMNRFWWDLSSRGIRMPGSDKPKKDSPEPQGITVMPGSYLVKLSIAGFSDSTVCIVKHDPRETFDLAGYNSRKKYETDFSTRIEKVTKAYDALREMNESVAYFQKKSEVFPDSIRKSLDSTNKTIKDSTNKLLERVIPLNPKQGINDFDDRISSKIGSALEYIRSSG